MDSTEEVERLALRVAGQCVLRVVEEELLVNAEFAADFARMMRRDSSPGKFFGVIRKHVEENVHFRESLRNALEGTGSADALRAMVATPRRSEVQ